MEPVPPAWANAETAASRAKKQYATWRMLTPPSVSRNLSRAAVAVAQKSEMDSAFQLAKQAKQFDYSCKSLFCIRIDPTTGLRYLL
jgi:hypothetical protein